MTNTSRHGYGIEMALPGILKYIAMTEQEEIFDRFNSTRVLMEGIVELLRDLDALGIRTAVINNNIMTGEALALAISRWIPESKFEFCLTSADLLIGKPWGDLFTAAARHADTEPSRCRYCGDGRRPDVDGARNGGMIPVLYDICASQPAEMRWDGGNRTYLTINHWNALGDILKNYNKNAAVLRRFYGFLYQIGMGFFI